jgi:hypothetical protein
VLIPTGYQTISMNKIKDRALTYSLLAHIRSKGQLVSGPISVFTPLIKRTLSKLNEKGIFSGKSITEIKVESDSSYGIDFPIPVLRTILAAIAREINSETERRFELFQDDSFQIKNYAFTEFEETMRLQSQQIDNLEKMFSEFCETCGENRPENSSILEFIEKNKLSLSKYLAHRQLDETKDYTIEAQFVEFFRQIPPVYETIRDIYLGSIIVGYIEYKTENIKTDIELLLDTNFILGLLDLNTPESTHTCRKVIEITKTQGYKLTALKDTLNETTALLKAKIGNFDLTFLQKKIYPEDIYNACDRRKLNSADLERITDNLEKEILAYGVSVIHDTTKYKNKARFSSEYESLKKHRHSDVAALHDATAVYYVREKRKKKIKDFENVNCWFINNSVSREKYDLDKGNNIEYQPELIKADDFLNIIWLSNPQINRTVDINEISEIGLNSLISIGLTSSLPRLSIIRELDDNIHKYAQDSGLTDADIVRVATRITTKQLIDIENLNKLAKQDKEQFVKRLNEEAQKQKELEEERIKKLDKILQELSNKNTGMQKIKKDCEEKSKNLDERITSVNGQSQLKDKTIQTLSSELEKERLLRRKDSNKRKFEKREQFIGDAVKKWRRKTNIELLICVIIFVLGVLSLLWLTDWNLKNASKLYNELKTNLIFSSIVFLFGTIFSAITFKKWYDKHYNHSNIENYKKGLKIPDELKDDE